MPKFAASLMLAIGVSLLASSTDAQLADTPWPMFRRDAGHTGQSVYEGPSIPALAWSYGTGGYVISSPALGSDGRVYVGSYDNNIHAVNPDGTLAWSYAAESRIFSSPALGSDGRLYVGSWEDTLYALNSDGTLAWR